MRDTPRVRAFIGRYTFPGEPELRFQKTFEVQKHTVIRLVLLLLFLLTRSLLAAGIVSRPFLSMLSLERLLLPSK